MSPAPGGIQQRIAESLADSLEPFVDGIEERDKVVSAALARAKLPAIPANETAVRAFVLDHLVPVVKDATSPEKAAAIDGGTTRMIGSVMIHYRVSPSKVPKAISNLVLVASRDPKKVAELGEHLGDAVSLQVISDPDALTAILMASVASAVLVDCASFEVNAGNIAAIAASVGAGKILLWGIPLDLEQELAKGPSPAPIACAPGTPMQHVAMLTKALAKKK